MNIYDSCEQELLLLGEPGAGKSTLLLDLARQLVKRAQQDVEHPFPVLLPLSSWTEKQQPLQEWLPAQLALIYDVPLAISRGWVLTNQVLPLLDGLDEVPQSSRAACLKAITDYRRTHLVPLVVCSRRMEYEEMEHQHRLVLHSAVLVQSLTKAQIDAYLVQCGEPMAALRMILQENPVLQEAATTPLMLSILILTYQDRAVSKRSSTGSLSAEPQHIFATYVQRMMERKATHSHHSPQDFISWLSWLARQMRQRNQAIFYLEHLQPGWLSCIQRRSYAWLAVRLPAILSGVLVGLAITIVFINLQYAVLGGILGWLFSKPATNKGTLLTGSGYKHQHRLRTGIVAGLIMGLIVGLGTGLHAGKEYGPDSWRNGSISGIIIGISFLVLSLLLPSLPPNLVVATPHPTQHWHFLTRFSQMIHGQRAGLVFVILGIGYGLANGMIYGMTYGLSTGLSLGLSAGFISVLVSLVLSAQTEGIRLTERLYWTWHSLMRSLLASKHMKGTLLVTSVSGLGFGLTFGLNAGLNNGLSFGLNEGISFGISFGIGFGLLYWMLLGLFQGIESSRIDDHARNLPNQGIRRSLSNSVLLALISSGLIGVIGLLCAGLSFGLFNVLSAELLNGLSAELSDELSSGLFNGLSVGLNFGLIPAVSGGLLVCALRGGLAALRHYIIRFLLARSHAFPWHAQRFLEEATTRILLRRVGGGYSFPHRQLLDYFADLPEMMP